VTEERSNDPSKHVTCLSGERGQGARLRLVSDRIVGVGEPPAPRAATEISPTRAGALAASRRSRATTPRLNSP
jgi:hypothetical protein